LTTRGFNQYGKRTLKDCDVEIHVYPEIRSATPKVSIQAYYLVEGKYPRPMFGVNEISLVREVENWKELLDQRALKVVERARRHVKEELCPHCGAVMLSKQIKHGELQGQRFLGCSQFPKCRGMKAPWKQTAAADDGKRVEEVHCPDCGSPLAIRYAKVGKHKGNRFYGCSAYPRCKRIVEADEFVALRLLSKDQQRKPDPPYNAEYINPV
jgi:ssDNA-binding Zn-finger/Zn-ribbon topoisomerase 1